MNKPVDKLESKSWFRLLKVVYFIFAGVLAFVVLFFVVLSFREAYYFKPYQVSAEGKAEWLHILFWGLLISLIMLSGIKAAFFYIVAGTKVKAECLKGWLLMKNTKLATITLIISVTLAIFFNLNAPTFFSIAFNTLESYFFMLITHNYFFQKIKGKFETPNKASIVVLASVVLILILARGAEVSEGINLQYNKIQVSFSRIIGGEECSTDGSSTKGENGKCYCNIGFEADSASNKCVKKVDTIKPNKKPVTKEKETAQCPMFSTYVNGSCSCWTGYVFNPSTNNCVNTDSLCKQQFGINSYSAGDKCFCQQGYHLNTNGDECVEMAFIDVISPRAYQSFGSSPIYVEGEISSNCYKIIVNASNALEGIEDEYELQKYKLGDTKFRYTIDPEYNNLAGGANRYLFTAYCNDDQIKQTEISIFFDKLELNYQGGSLF